AVANNSQLLASGLHARLATLGEHISELLHPGKDDPQPRDLGHVEEAFTRVRDHRRCDPTAPEFVGALNAVRLLRWLATDPAPPTTVADGVASHMAVTAWVDRAASALYTSATDNPALSEAYQRLYTRVRERRARIDEAFARRVAAWTEVSSHIRRQPHARNLLSLIAVPVANQQAQITIQPDGLSAAFAGRRRDDNAASGQVIEVRRSDWGRDGPIASLTSNTT